MIDPEDWPPIVFGAVVFAVLTVLGLWVFPFFLVRAPLDTYTIVVVLLVNLVAAWDQYRRQRERHSVRRR